MEEEKLIQLHDKKFRTYISSDEIQHAIDKIAERINHDLKGTKPLFLCVLNGAFMFASDLMKRIDIDCEISFVKLASYSGTSSTGNVKQLIGLDEHIKGRTVVIIEDIVDTGITMESLLHDLDEHSPKDVKIATFLFKPNAYQKDFFLDYVSLEVPNDFLVGYGLDYDGLGRNLEDIYVLAEDES